ncbi:MAG: hypothetical protein WD070_05980 [Pirellulaceae bacterium]
MKRFAVVAAFAVLSAGCHAPMPNWNMFSPDGATRVRPPQTGGYGTPQPYYAPGATPSTVAPTSTPVGTGFRPSSDNRWSNIDDPAIGPAARDQQWEPTRPTNSSTQVADLRDADVVLASHEAAAPIVPSTVVVEHDGPIRILPPKPSTTTSDPPRLQGMVVNDTTRSTEPQPFVPSGRVIDISQLPDSPVAVRAAASNSSSVSSQASASQASVSDGGWKTRTTTLRPF